MRDRAPAHAHVYRIRVEGPLDPSCSSRLGGMAIESSSDGGSQVISTLTGSLPDQCALSGVLNALVDRRHSLISVKRLPSERALEEA